MKIHVEVVSVEGHIYSGEAAMVFVAGEMGELGIAPRHAPLLTRMRPGPVRVRHEEDGEDESFFVSGGVLEVQPHLVTVMADTIERAEEIDEAAAEKAKQKAEEELSNADEREDIAQAQAELAEAAARLSLVKQLRSKR